MKKILYVFYRYYDDGPTKDIAYLKSITVFLLLLFINILTLSAFLGLKLPNMDGKSTIFKYSVFLVFFGLPSYFLINTFVKKEDLKDEKLEKQYKKMHGWILIGYFLLSVFLFILAIKFKK